MEANYLYQLNTKKIAGSTGFDISVEEWKDGTSIDWVTIEDGISVMDDKATVIAGTDIKGTYVKIAADATMPYTIKRVVTDYSSAALDAAYDGSLPKWLTISSSTKDAGSGLYRHEIIYTVLIRIQALRFLVYRGKRSSIRQCTVVSPPILSIIQ